MYSSDLGPPVSKQNGLHRVYADPFRTYTSTMVPRNPAEALRWSEAMWLRNGTYSRALKRVVSYFITQIEVIDAEDNEKRKYEKFLNEIIKAPIILSQLGSDRMCYGNSFTSLFIPFKRSLICENCGLDRPLSKLNYSFRKAEFKWKCENCGSERTCKKPQDRRTNDESLIKVRRWNPHEIRILTHPISDERIYLWDPPKDVCNQILKGDRFFLETFPWEMVEAICNNKMFEFAPGVVFHLEEKTLAGIRTGGWGISQTMNVFHQLYYTQTAKMYNEVFMNEYIMPFRCVSPAKASGAAGDPLQSVNVGGVNGQLLAMLDKHRRNPGGYYALPFPIEYQSLGGEGIQMATHEHIGAATDELLNAAGVPSELYKGTLQFEALPTALRLFQQTWPDLVAEFNSWLDWLMHTLATVFNWDRASARLKPVTLADDLEKRNILLQLLAGNRVSAETALSPLGLNPDDELKKTLDEQKKQMEAQAKFENDMSQRQSLQTEMQGTSQDQSQGGAAPAGPGGQPGPMSGPSAAGKTPEDVMAQAQEEAQRLLGMPYELRRKDMAAIKSTNPTLHALVKAQMQDMRQSASSEGGYQALQQQVGGPMGQQPSPTGQ